MSQAKTTIQPTRGRICYVHAKNYWSDARAGIVVTAFPSQDGEVPTVSVHAFCDPSTDRGREHLFLEKIPIFDADSDVPPGIIEYAKWMPYQMGQASLTKQIAERAGVGVDASQQEPALAESEQATREEAD